jgi:hypothetical protein
MSISKFAVTYGPTATYILHAIGNNGQTLAHQKYTQGADAFAVLRHLSIQEHRIDAEYIIERDKRIARLRKEIGDLLCKVHDARHQDDDEVPFAPSAKDCISNAASALNEAMGELDNAQAYSNWTLGEPVL